MATQKAFNIYLGLNTPQGVVTTQDFLGFLKLVDDVFDSYTVTNAKGRWHGENESTKILTVQTTSKSDVVRISEEYKNIFSQEAVAIQEVSTLELI
tara:strand:- start:718 stop:1005 length:288 start_codon:yes stop_codon:yes gene_type:complete